ncbi:MAG: hypothetical protein LKE30_07745 [Bacteroidales bacterium]|nr:hypothetical protein [Bacteroidales bacterium]
MSNIMPFYQNIMAFYQNIMAFYLQHNGILLLLLSKDDFLNHYYNFINH